MCINEENIDLEKENIEQKNNDTEIFENNVTEYSEGYEDNLQVPKELRKIRTQAYDKRRYCKNDRKGSYFFRT